MRTVTDGIAQETNTCQWQPTTLANFAHPGFGTPARGRETLDIDGAGTVYGATHLHRRLAPVRPALNFATE